MKTAKVFSPSGISSFFTIQNTGEGGVPIKDPRYIGALGGGFTIRKGMETTVKIKKAKRNSISAVITDDLSDPVVTTSRVIKKILDLVDESYTVEVRHDISVPIGSGFGTSAAGALSTAFALSYLMDLELSLNQIGMIAHEAELDSKTGLGTVAPLMVGGGILTIQAGGPGVAVTDRLLLSPDMRMLIVHINPIFTTSVLKKVRLQQKINTLGKTALEKIIQKPTLPMFYQQSLFFARQVGFMSTHLEEIISTLLDAGAIGATQNMIGETVHSSFWAEDVQPAIKKIKQTFPHFQIFDSEIDYGGIRFI